jgi:hypothetical protein
LAGLLSRMVWKSKAYWVSVGTSGSNEPLGRSRHTRVYNIKMSLRNILCVDMDWKHLALDREQRNALKRRIISFQVP